MRVFAVPLPGNRQGLFRPVHFGLRQCKTRDHVVELLSRDQLFLVEGLLPTVFRFCVRTGSFGLSLGRFDATELTGVIPVLDRGKQGALGHEGAFLHIGGLQDSLDFTGHDHLLEGLQQNRSSR